MMVEAWEQMGDAIGDDRRNTRNTRVRMFLDVHGILLLSNMSSGNSSNDELQKG